jgi:hypothetical protein
MDSKAADVKGVYNIKGQTEEQWQVDHSNSRREREDNVNRMDKYKGLESNEGARRK